MNRRSDPPQENPATTRRQAMPPRSVRTFLFWLVLACLLPGILGAGLLLVQEYREQRARVEKDTGQMARALAQAVDNQIFQVEALAHGLAGANSLAQGDLAGFHRRARQTLQQAKLAASVVLVDRSGWQVLNTLKEYGEPLPFNGNPPLVRRVFETGQPVVSDLYLGAVMRRPIMTVAVPVFIDGKATYVLILPILLGKFDAILKAQRLPPGWTASILDGTGSIAARSSAAELPADTKAAPEFRQRYLESSEGAMETLSQDGLPVFLVFTRSPATGWGVIVEIPQADFDIPLTRNFSILALGIAGLFAIGLGLAWYLGRRLAVSFRALATSASALGSGADLALPAAGIKEAAEATRAMAEAADLLRQRQSALLASEAKYRTLFTKLRESESQLRQLIATLPGMVWTSSPDGRIDFMSQQWLDYTGTTEKSQLCEGFLESIHPQDRSDVMLRWQEAVSGKASLFDVEYRLRRHDGSYRWFKSRGTPLPDADGKVARWLGVVTDIDDLKTVQQALVASQAELLEAQRLGKMGTWFWDAHTDSITASGEMLRMFGRQSIPPLAEQAGILFAPEDWRQVQAAVRHCVHAGGSYHMELPALRPDGTSFWIVMRGERVPNPGSRLYSLRGTVQDITDRKRAEQEIERLNADLESRVEERTAELVAANRQLEGYTFATSHDLKGPLGRINSFSTLLERNYRERLEGDGLLFLDIIRQNATRLAQLVDDLLSHARVAQQSLELQKIDLGAAVTAIVKEKADDIQDKGAVVRVSLPATQVFADPHALGQALGNLLENALKYSSRMDSPCIDIGGARHGEYFRLWVRDNGIGFKMEYHDRIFQMFKRLHTYTEYSGSGVGLALVKRAMERMGGKVWAESTPGQGATFYLELQAAS